MGVTCRSVSLLDCHIFLKEMELRRKKEERTYVEDLKASNIQYTDKLDTFLSGFQGFVDSLDQPFEETIEHGLSHGTDRVQDLHDCKPGSIHRRHKAVVGQFVAYLVDVTTLGDELVTDLDPGFQEVGVQRTGINSQQLGNSLTFLHERRG